MEPNNGPREVLTAVVAKEDWLQLLRQWPLCKYSSNMSKKYNPKEGGGVLHVQSYRGKFIFYTTISFGEICKEKRKSSSGL